MKELFKLIQSAKKQYGIDKAKILLAIGEMSEDELQKICDDVWEIKYPSYGDYEGLYLVKASDIEGMLNEFWQRSSDACPLEAGEGENQVKEWEAWVPQKLAKIDHL